MDPSVREHISHYHVRVPDGFDFVHVGKSLDARVKQSVERIEQRHNFLTPRPSNAIWADKRGREREIKKFIDSSAAARLIEKQRKKF
jgi:hypothetical protein